VPENQPAVDLLWRVRCRWKLRLRQVTADTQYGTAATIVAIEDARSHGYIPLPDPEARTSGIFGAAAFTDDAEYDAEYDAEGEVFHCPGGETLRFRNHRYTERLRVDHAPTEACNACSRKAHGTQGRHGRQVARHFDAADLTRVRGDHAREPYPKALRKRQGWGAPLFAETKDWHGLPRFRLRGLENVNGEALLIAAGQNLKRLLHWRGWGRRPVPNGSAGRVLPFLRPTLAATS
jgi:hypothetical protein